MTISKNDNITKSKLDLNPNDISFFVKLSHELKSPLNSIMALSSFLQDSWKKLDEKTIKGAFDGILESTEKLNFMVEELIHTSPLKKNIDFKLEENDIVNILKDSVDNCIKLNSDKVGLNIILESSLEGKKINFDVFWFKQLMTNLLTNAINYAPNEDIIVRLNEKEGQIFVSVIDKGVGLSEDDVKKIFKPYNLGTFEHEYTHGTGLGLSICKEIVEAHNGEIRAFNNECKGATIQFFIPN